MTTPTNETQWSGPQKVWLTGILLAWFAAAYAIGTEGWAANEQPALFAPIALTAVVPVAVFLAIYALSDRFRGFVLSQDIRRLTMLQHWRVIGFVFLPLYIFGVLPGLFAWPAGIGDVAIGLAAAAMVARIDRDPGAATSRALVRFQLFGLLDFAVAIVTSALSAGVFVELVAAGPTSASLEVWPMNLFPSFIVPIFIIMHLTVLLKIRHLRRIVETPVNGVLRAA